KGCATCNFTGMRSRVAIYEVMPVSPEIRDLILRNAPTSELREVAESQGMRTRSEEHTSELQSHLNLVCRLLLEKKKKKNMKASGRAHLADPASRAIDTTVARKQTTQDADTTSRT